MVVGGGGGLHTDCRVTPTSFLVEVGLLQQYLSVITKQSGLSLITPKTPNKETRGVDDEKIPGSKICQNK